MPSPIESAIERMERLKAELLVADAKMKAFDVDAEIRRERIEAEMMALKLIPNSLLPKR